MAEHVSAQLLAEAFRVQLQNADQQQWWADEPESMGGAGSAPNPLEILLSSLGACTAITLKMYAQHKNWDVKEVKVDLVLDADGAPKAGQSRKIARTIEIEGNLDEAQRSRLLKVAESCPVHKLLVGEVVIQTQLSQ